MEYYEMQMQKNNEILTNFNVNAIKRRLKNEIDRMYGDNMQIVVELNENREQLRTNAEVILYIYISEIDRENQLHNYKFGITIDYPFRAPKIYYQGYPYIDFLKNPRPLDSGYNTFKQITGLNCFCCNSYNCSDTWSPSVILTKIMDEIKYFRKIKRDIINKLLADKIKQKYLIDDIDLDSWLFCICVKR